MDGDGKLQWKRLFQQSALLQIFFNFLIFFPESVVKVLLSRKNLGKEKGEAMENILSQTVQNYVKFNDLSRYDHAQAFKFFADLIMNTYTVNLVSIGEDSVVEGNPDKVAESK